MNSFDKQPGLFDGRIFGISSPKIHERLSTIEARWEEIRERLPDPDLFRGISREEQIRWFAYFYRVPRSGRVPDLASGHVLGLYDPFAKRSRFPVGLRYSCNVYTGCSHACRYCYTRLYCRQPPGEAKPKAEFRTRLLKDLNLIGALDLPPVPLHVSLSTDLFQSGLETRHQDSLFLLKTLASSFSERISETRIITRNPSMAVEAHYLDALLSLKGRLTIQVSLSIINREASLFYEPGAPLPETRMRGVEILAKKGIRVVLRIDPLFPREPLPGDYFRTRTFSEVGILPAQTEENVLKLVDFASNAGCVGIIISALKIPARSSGIDSGLRETWGYLYREAAERHPDGVYGNYLRLPERYQREVLFPPVFQRGGERGIPVHHCKQDVLGLSISCAGR